MDLEPRAPRPCTAFEGTRRLLAGDLRQVALQLKALTERRPRPDLLVFDDETGRVVDLDLRGSNAEVLERLRVAAAAAGAAADAASGAAAGGAPGRAAQGGASASGDVAMAGGEDATAAARGPGRPRLGVVAREVTLLPRHWDWLGEQPGGASAALRRLVEAARRGPSGRGEVRRAQEAAYKFMTALAGDAPGYEEATRALFAGQRERFEALTRGWPGDVGAHARALAEAAFAAPAGPA